SVFFSSRRRHTRWPRDWSSDVCSSDLAVMMLETSSGREHHDSAITTANYEFKLAGEQEIGPYHCLVLEATPKRKDKYLFEGTIWVDAEDFAVVKIAGHPAKKPSFWINRADFVRQYQKVDGFWVPYRDETSVEVKMYGRRVF